MIQKAARAAIILTAFLIESALSSQVLQQESLTLTVSKGGSSLVQDNRKIAYDAGVSTIYFTDLPTLVNESTITITPNNSNGTIQILEKSFLKNGSSKYETLKNYIGKNITFDTLNSLIKTRTGKLIAYGQDYLKIKNTLGQIQIFSDFSNLRFPALNENPITTPTIAFVANTASPTVASTQTSYYVSGLSWAMNYIVILNSDDTKASLSSTLVIDNKSGKNYDNLTLKIASYDNLINNSVKLNTSASSNVSEINKSNFNVQIIPKYVIFNLQYPTSLKINQTKQIDSFQTVNVPIAKNYSLFIQAGGKSSQNLAFGTIISINNSKENGLGDPLVAGKIQLYRKSQDQNLVFLNQYYDSLTLLNNRMFVVSDSQTKLKAKLNVLNKTYSNSTTNSRTINSTNSTSSSRNYRAIMDLIITNQDNKPANVKVEMQNGLVQNLSLSYLPDYDGEKWSSGNNKLIHLVIPPEASSNLIQWVEEGTEGK